MFAHERRHDKVIHQNNYLSILIATCKNKWSTSCPLGSIYLSGILVWQLPEWSLWEGRIPQYSMQTGRVKFITMCLQIRICLAKHRVMLQSTTIWFRIWFQIEKKDSDSRVQTSSNLGYMYGHGTFFLKAYPLLNHRYRGTITIQSQLFTSREQDYHFPSRVDLNY